MIMDELWVVGRINLAGVVVAARAHKAIVSIKVEGVKKRIVLWAETDAIPVAVIASHALKASNEFQASPSNTDIVRNPSVAVAATTYDLFLRFHCPLPGKAFRINLELAQFNIVFGATVTAATTDWSVTPVFATSNNQTQYIIVANRVSALPNKSYRNAEKVALFNAVQWSTVLTSIQLGKDGLSAIQAAQLEDISNDRLRGLATNGTSVATRTLPILDPATAADVFALLYNLSEGSGDVVIQAGSAQTYSAVIFSRAAEAKDVQLEVA
jgi:hypothetical protein